jgi:Zn-dependent M28 family amino/carboxypeptidase
VQGKIVFIDQPTERTKTGAGYGRSGVVRRNGPARAGAKGAAAVLIRSIGTGNQRFAHTGATRYQDDVPRIPAAALAVPDADILADQFASGQNVRFRLDLGSHYLPDTTSANVIGEIRGREKPEEIVLLGAHLDSWDVGTGAHDDGSGCATVMTAAHLISQLDQAPRRTIRVVLFANEEFGLSGARAYAEAHADELSNHQLAIESDLGADRVWAFATRVDERALGEAQRVAALLEPLGIEHLGNEAWGGADLIPLRPARVPLADLRQDASRYFDLHHTIDDTFDKVDPESLAQNVAAYTAVAYWAAETPTSFTPAPDDEAARPGR